MSAKKQKREGGGSLQPGIEPGSGQLKPAFYHCAGAPNRNKCEFFLWTREKAHRAPKCADFSKNDMPFRQKH